MVHRDPQTGQFVGDDSGTVHGLPAYSDIEPQPLRTTFAVTADATNDETNEFQTGDADPAGGLARGQVAELVGFHYQFHVRLNNGGEAVPVDPVQLLSGFWYGTMDDPPALDGGPTKSVSLSEDGTDDAIISEDISDSIEADVFLRKTGRVTYPFAADANGTGGGEFGTEINGFVNYRDFLGIGPVLDRLDDLTIHQNAQIKGPHETTGESLLSLMNYWNVMEEEEAREAGIV